MTTVIKYVDERGQNKTVRAAYVLGIEEIDQPTNCRNVQALRLRHPDAYTLWSVEDDLVLEEQFREGVHVEELAKIFKRQPSAVQSRLYKLGLVDDWKFPT